MYRRNTGVCLILLVLLGTGAVFTQRKISDRQRANLLKRFPEADTNNDGKLSDKEILAYRKLMRPSRGNVAKTFKINPGWEKDRFPENAVCYKSPEEIKELYAKTLTGRSKRLNPVVSYKKPTDGSLRIVGTGHSFMAPGYRSLPLIAKLAGLTQPPLLTHVSGGMTGSARYKWEQENGIFQFDGKPIPKLLSSIANAKWDAMTWGPYYQDRPEFYACWIDFCLKHNPDMKFYLSDAWPQLEQFKSKPKSEDEMTFEAIQKLGEERNEGTAKLINALREKYPNKVFVMPTSDAMVLAVREYHKGNLPGIDGIHKAVGGKERSLWRDQLGHLGPGLDLLEGYVFYATLYGKSPESIEKPLAKTSAGSFPSVELDEVFRKLAWEAVSNHPLSGVMR